MNHNDAHNRFANVHAIEAVSDALRGAACWNAATPRAEYRGPLAATAPARARTRTQAGRALATADAADVLDVLRRQADDPDLNAQEARRRESRQP
jgi:hypothetical protein